MARRGGWWIPIWLLAALSVVLGTPAPASAAPQGSGNVVVDPSRWQNSGFNGAVTAVATQPDGKVLVGGTFTSYAGVPRGHLARLNTDGSLDLTFAGDGVLGDIDTIALAPGGKVVVGGSISPAAGQPLVGIARFNADGSRDDAFSIGSGFNDRVLTLAVAPDGKITAGGLFRTYNGVGRGGIARLNANGSLDTSFDPGSGFWGSVNSVVVMTDGRIVVGGGFFYYNTKDVYNVVRLASNGALDTGFNVGTGTGGGAVRSVAVQADGKVLIGGEFTTFNGSERKHLARLTTTGTVDPAFDPYVGADGTISSVKVLSDGKVLVAGEFTAYYGEYCPGLARVLSTGDVDRDFVCDGYLNAGVRAMALQADGKTIVGGDFTMAGQAARSHIARIDVAGGLDATFKDGTVFNGTVNAVAAQADGKFIVGGDFTSTQPVSRTRIARVQADGTLDASFNPGVGANGVVYAVAVQADGKIVIGGTFTSVGGTARTRIARLTADGTVDATFVPTTGCDGDVRTVAIQADGRVVIGGDFTNVNSVSRPRIARLNTNGTLDATFNPGAGFDAMVTSALVQPDGRIVTGGLFTAFSGVARFHIARLATNGTLDATFNPGTGFDGHVLALARQADGRLVAAGMFTHFNAASRSGVARLTATGALDPTFDPGVGIVGWGFAATVQSDAKIVVGGAFESVGGTPRSGIARLLPNGTLDADYDPGSGFDRLVAALAAQPGGKIFAGGMFTTFDGVAVTGAASFAEVPTAPTIVEAQPDYNSGVAYLNLAFTTPANAGSSPISGYEHSLDGGGTWTRSSNQTASTYVVANARTDGVPNYVRLRAVNPYGHGKSSAEFARVVNLGLPGSVTILSATPGNGTVSVSFSGPPVPTGSLAVVNYQFSIDNGTWTSRLPQSTASPIVITGLSNGVEHKVRLRAVNAFGVGPATPNVFFTPFGPATAPRDVVSNVGDRGASVLFSPPANSGGAPVTNYKYTLDAGATWTPRDPAATSSPLAITGLSNGTTYKFSLRAVTAYGDGTPSAVVDITPKGPPPPPTALVATPGDGSVSVTFTPPGSNGGSPITNYKYSVDDGATWLPRSPTSVTSPLVISGLANGTSYRVRLLAVSGLGDGTPSAAVAVTPLAAGSLVFVPVAPGRVLDTRLSQGGAGPIVPLEAGMRTVSVAAVQAGGAPEVPAGAVAVAYNVTVPGPGAGGHLRVMPGDATSLTGASAVNFRAGESIANGLVAKLAPDRTLKLYNGATAAVDAIVDVVGYFVPAASASAPQLAAGRFTPVAPVRVYDSNTGGGLTAAQATTTVDLSPVVPSGGSAVAYNITVVGPAGSGHLRVFPADQAMPNASSINFAAADRVANGLTVQVSADRTIKVFNGSGVPVRFLVDVVGYYSGAGQYFHAADPTRVLDTRTSSGGTGPVPVTAADGSDAPVYSLAQGQAAPRPEVVPAGATAVAFNATVAGATSAGHLRVWPADQALTPASTLNWPGAGYTRANGSVVGVDANRSVKFYNGASTPTEVLLDINGYYQP